MRDGRTNERTLKIELLSQWKLEAEFRNMDATTMMVWMGGNDWDALMLTSHFPEQGDAYNDQSSPHSQKICLASSFCQGITQSQATYIAERGGKNRGSRISDHCPAQCCQITALWNSPKNVYILLFSFSFWGIRRQ